ncbi:unnamed protein product [Amoebophrya sp. A120]|nr:unnamed protein product [Amoebophrya sp. A120]|eukprot:GSA120T00012608001.1
MEPISVSLDPASGASSKLEDFSTMAKKYGLEDPNPSSIENLFPLLLAKEDCDPECLTYQLAKTYVPFLGASSYDKICQEPASLKNELHFLRHEMENLASQNVGSFLSNTTLAASVSDEEFPEILQRYRSIANLPTSIKQQMEAFYHDIAPSLNNERTKLTNVLTKLTTIQELLEVPQLLDACIRANMFDETLDLLSFCQHLFHSAFMKNRIGVSSSGAAIASNASLGDNVSSSLTAGAASSAAESKSSPNHSALLELLEAQVARQRTHFEESLLNQLAADIHLPACVRVIGYLRRLGSYNEAEIRTLFLEQRAAFIDKHKKQIEKNLANVNPVGCLRAATDLMRTYVFDIGMHYKALFFQSVSGQDRRQTEVVFSNWLQLQLRWFFDLLQSQLACSAGSTTMQQNRQLTSVVPTQIYNDSALQDLDAAGIATIQKCVQHCSNTMKLLHCQFFPAVQLLFVKRLLFLVTTRLDAALENFQTGLRNFDFLVGSAGTSTTSTGSSAFGVSSAQQSSTSSQFMIENAHKLMQHRPLAVLTNDFINLFNELRQCAIFEAKGPIIQQLGLTVEGVMNVLRNYQQEFLSGHLQYGITSGGPGGVSEEFGRFVQNFQQLFVPLVNAHLKAIYGNVAGGANFSAASCTLDEEAIGKKLQYLQLVPAGGSAGG